MYSSLSQHVNIDVVCSEIAYVPDAIMLRYVRTML